MPHLWHLWHVPHLSSITSMLHICDVKCPMRYDVIYYNCHILCGSHTCMWHSKWCGICITLCMYVKCGMYQASYMSHQWHACQMWHMLWFTDVTSATPTNHWLLQIVGHKYIIAKLVWVLLFLTGICVFGYFSYKLITQYRQYETATDVQVQEFHNILLFIWVT